MGFASYLKHGSFGCALLAFGYIVANAVPFFTQLLGLIGGFLAGPINFLIPIVLFLVAQGQYLNMAAADNETGAPSIVPSMLKLTVKAYWSLPVWERVLIPFIACLIALTMVVGVTEQVLSIVKLEASLGAPFACHALGV